jgi:hypothetical protein
MTLECIHSVPYRHPKVVDKNSIAESSLIRLYWLPDTDENSQPLRAEIPIIMRGMAHGELVWSINHSAGYGKLDLASEAELRLTKFFEIPEDLISIRMHAQLDRLSLAIRYSELIEQGHVKNQADLARHLGVSRAWITKVMNELKQGRTNIPIWTNFPIDFYLDIYRN